MTSLGPGLKVKAWVYFVCGLGSPVTPGLISFSPRAVGGAGLICLHEPGSLARGSELSFAASCKNIPAGHVHCTSPLTCLVLLPPPREEANLLCRPHHQSRLEQLPAPPVLQRNCQDQRFGL